MSNTRSESMPCSESNWKSNRLSGLAVFLWLGWASAALAADSARVVIIGAGAAGLEAVHELDKQGIASAVYTEEVGGRIRAGTDTFGTGLVINGGAELVDSTHSYVLGRMSEFNIPVLPRRTLDGYREGDFFYGNEVISSSDLWIRILAGNSDALRRMEKDQKTIAREGRSRAHLESLPGFGPEGSRLDQLSISQYLADVHADDLLKSYVKAALQSETGVSPERLSAMTLFLYMHFQPKRHPPLEFLPSNDEAYRVLGGTRKLIDAYQERHDDAIHTGYRLTAIHSADAQHFDLDFSTPDGIRTIQADHVVMAIPFSSLQNVEMNIPDLPESTRQAIQRTTYGSHGKLILFFDERPWLEQMHTGSALGDAGFQLWDSSEGQMGRSGSLTVYLGNLDENMTSEKETAIFLSRLEKLFPGISDHFLGSQLYAWPHSYSGSFIVGERSSVHMQVSSVGHLHFAGEHVSESQFGYIDGAVETGHVAARRIASEIQGGDCVKREMTSRLGLPGSTGSLSQ